jgi:8-oxo-dGTP pyrophosphatase MutT (NUDIX family)
MSELIDLVNSKGEIMRTAVERDDMHSYEEERLYLQNIVAVVINDLGHVLVQERAQTKRISPGHIDHVCGAILSGESPEETVRRETYEEIGIELDDVHLIAQGVNAYERYRYLFRGESKGLHLPQPRNLGEVAWTAYKQPDELRAKNRTRKLKFVKGFFEDLDRVIGS